ncbi:3193_t:CDS:2, partial [Acaulospora colombiana]
TDSIWQESQFYATSAKVASPKACSIRNANSPMDKADSHLMQKKMEYNSHYDQATRIRNPGYELVHGLKAAMNSTSANTNGPSTATNQTMSGDGMSNLDSMIACVSGSYFRQTTA